MVGSCDKCVILNGIVYRPAEVCPPSIAVNDSTVVNCAVRDIEEAETVCRHVYSVQCDVVAPSKDYLTVIKGLKPKDAQNGSAWLQGIVDEITTETRQRLFSE